MKFYRYAIIALMVALTAIGLGSCGGGGSLENGGSLHIDQANPTVIRFNDSSLASSSAQFTVSATLSDGSSWPNWPLVDWTTTCASNTVTGSSGVTLTVPIPNPTTSSYTCTLTATSQGHPDMSSTVTVIVNVLQSITIAPPNPANINILGTQQFTATGLYSGASTVDISTTATWNSNPTNIVSINSTGLATGLNSGTTAISATLGNKTSVAVSQTVN